MKAMIVSDFAVLRSALLQLLGICLVIALFMGYASNGHGALLYGWKEHNVSLFDVINYGIRNWH